MSRAIPEVTRSAICPPIKKDAGNQAPLRYVEAVKKTGSEERELKTGRLLTSCIATLAAGGLALSACSSATASTATSPVHAATSAGAGGCSASSAKVTATATGNVSAKPNLLTMVIDVHTKAASATTALSENNTQAQALISVLKGGGLATSDLSTSGLSISPSYGGNPLHVTGYQVDDTVSAKVHKLSSAGSLIDAAAAKLGNDMRFQGLQFSLTHDSAPSLQARSLAVRTATARARAMSTAAGKSLGALCSVTDISASSQVVHPAYFSKSAFGVAAPAVPIQPGTQRVSARVRVVYALG